MRRETLRHHRQEHGAERSADATDRPSQSGRHERGADHRRSQREPRARPASQTSGSGADSGRRMVERRQRRQEVQKRRQRPPEAPQRAGKRGMDNYMCKLNRGM